MIPYIDDPFTKKMLPQIQSCTFLCQLQGMAPGTLVYVENSKKVPKSIDDCPWIILNTSMRLALIRLSLRTINSAV